MDGKQRLQAVDNPSLASNCEALCAEPAVLGYDLLDEPILPAVQNDQLQPFYIDVSKAIRSADPDHILFVEGHDFAMSDGFPVDLGIRQKRGNPECASRNPSCTSDSPRLKANNPASTGPLLIADLVHVPFGAL